MFHDIPQAMQKRMQYLEERDYKDRSDGTTHLKRLRQIPPETGRFLSLIASQVPDGKLIELGTSAGYSSMWISLACKIRGDILITFEVLEEKQHLAEETFSLAEIADIVKLVKGDARKFLADYDDIAFCFLDAEKELYRELYDMVVPRMVTGGILLADNAISHQEALQPMLDYVEDDARVDSLIVPIGKGVLMCRKI